MGRSLRRIKRRKPRIIKRKSKTPFKQSKLPDEITAARPSMKQKLGAEASWDDMQKIDANYESSGLVLDATARFGRNSRRDPIQQLAAAREVDGDEEPEAEEQLDDDLVAAMAQVRSTGKAAPKRLTPRQRQIVQRLLEAHGQDVAAMSRDRRLNPMQHSCGELERMLAAFEHWKEGSGVGFRVPTKRLA